MYLVGQMSVKEQLQDEENKWIQTYKLLKSVILVFIWFYNIKHKIIKYNYFALHFCVQFAHFFDFDFRVLNLL